MLRATMTQYYSMRHFIDIVESEDDIIPDELPEYNTEAKQLEAVRQNPYTIRHIENPSEPVQLAAVKANGCAIRWILKNGIVPSITVQRAAVIEDPLGASCHMIDHKLPISKMIQWTAAKRIKELNLTDEFCEFYEVVLDKLDPDVQEYLKSDKT